jgi:hypothetical protein
VSIVEIGKDYGTARPYEAWEPGRGDAITGLRLVLSDAYADASDAEMAQALGEVMDVMSPAEAFNFGAALNQIARGAGQALSDPTVASIARTALPVAGQVLGTVYGGPAGGAIGGQLGTIAANALPAPRPARPPGTATPGPAGAVAPGPLAPAAVAPTAGTPLAGGSTAAAQGLVLAGHPLMQQALASAAFGQHGQPQVAGIPVAQLLGLLGQVMGRAAAEADELLYLSGGEANDAEGERWSPDSTQDLYISLIDAESLDLAEALEDLEEAE